jgi:hypothetical protein
MCYSFGAEFGATIVHSKKKITMLRKSYFGAMFLFVIPFYLQSVLALFADCVKTYTIARRRVLSSAPL